MKLHSTLPLADRPPLDHDALRDINEIALWAGALMLANGSETDRIEETVHRLGTALGANWLDILVSPNALIVTTSSGGEFRTRVRRVPVLGINLRILDEINTFSRRVADGELDRYAARLELVRISHIAPYNRWLIVVMAGISCAAFARLFGGGLPEMLTAGAASALALGARHILARRNFNPFLLVLVTALLASLFALIPFRLGWVQDRSALLAAVVVLVPGVHLINAAEDMLKGHLITGLARGVMAILIAACIALGILTATWIMGITVI